MHPFFKFVKSGGSSEKPHRKYNKSREQIERESKDYQKAKDNQREALNRFGTTNTYGW